MASLELLPHPSATVRAAMETPCISPVESNTSPHANSSANPMPRYGRVIGPLMTYFEAHKSPASDGLTQISWRDNEDRKY